MQFVRFLLNHSADIRSHLDNIRLWEVKFQTVQPWETFPMPHEIVLERQVSGRYRIDGFGRPRDMTQLSCTLSGEGFFRYGKDCYRLTPGRGFVCRLGDPESSYRYPEHGSEPWIFLWMDFIGDAAVRMVDELTARHGHVFDFPEDSGLIRYLKSFRSRKRGIRFVTPADGARIVCNVLSLLDGHMERAEAASPGRRLTQAVKEVISSNPGSGADLNRIAGLFGVSREHLSRVFHEQTGITLREYMEEERMQFALHLLRDNFMPVKEVAERTGYSGTASFGRAFQRRFGRTPAGCRRGAGRDE